MNGLLRRVESRNLRVVCWGQIKKNKKSQLQQTLTFLMAHLGAQSNSKCTEHLWDKDRLSNLPDSLLCHILSFLPTNEAVVTSILSSRWKTLWTLVPKIDFQDTSIRGRSVSPLRILYSVLAQHTAPILSNFTLMAFSLRLFSFWQLGRHRHIAQCPNTRSPFWVWTTFRVTPYRFSLQNISGSGIIWRNWARSSSFLSTPKPQDSASLRNLLYFRQLFLEPLLRLPEPRRFDGDIRVYSR